MLAPESCKVQPRVTSWLRDTVAVDQKLQRYWTFGMAGSGEDLNSKYVIELAREKIGEALRVQQLQKSGETLRIELEQQRQNAISAVRQMEQEAEEGRLVRSELENLRIANGELKMLLEKAEKETENVRKELCAARAQVVWSKETTEKLLIDRSEMTANMAQRWEKVAQQSTQVSEALLCRPTGGWDAIRLFWAIKA